MADEPIRERILQDCEASLLAIDGSGDYHYALADVQRGKAVPEDLTKLPAAFLDEGDEAVLQDTNLLLTRRLPLTLEVWFRSGEGDLPTVANRLLADVERALTADPTRGGLAVRMDMVSNSIVRDESPGVLGTVRVQFEVEYRTLRGNPASKG